MLDRYNVSFPSQLKFGAGSFDETGVSAAALGSNAFVMLDPFLKDSALEDRLDEQLKSKRRLDPTLLLMASAAK